MSDFPHETTPEPEAPPAPSSNGDVAPLGYCPKCSVGVAHAVTSDENGTNYQCFACAFGWSVPATEEGAGLHPGNITADASLEELKPLARQYGIDPNKYDTKADLRDAIQQRTGNLTNA